ncbi:MAG: hypothetical protein RMN51_08140 [Verrucomicrobiota bacterium]|nr:hypothetical protein [Limisphaera sp.]MDW8382058.1 hypothetical protein [Verrucomicrobiota bacterium]
MQMSVLPPLVVTNGLELAAGGRHVLARTRDGRVVGWGSTRHLSIPVVVDQARVPAGLSNVVAIAAGLQHSLAVRADGSVVAWGDNTEGQCRVPEGLGPVVSVAAGDDFSTAIVGRRLHWPPRLTQVAYEASYGPTLWLHGVDGPGYRVEISSNLRDWSLLLRVDCTNGAARIRDPEARGQRTRFYRVAVEP